MNSYLITPRGDIQEAVPKIGAAFTVTELQDMVGGYIEVMDVNGGVLVYDSDGAIKEKLYNEKATKLILDSNPEWDDFVAGNAVFCKKIIVD